jgi:hypothetical protein
MVIAGASYGRHYMMSWLYINSGVFCFTALNVPNVYFPLLMNREFYCPVVLLNLHLQPGIGTTTKHGPFPREVTKMCHSASIRKSDSYEHRFMTFFILL